MNLKYKLAHLAYVFIFKWIPWVKWKLEELRYYFWEFVDPRPKEIKDGDDKYVLRRCRKTYYILVYLDGIYQRQIKPGRYEHLSKKDQKKLFEFASRISTRLYEIKQYYQEILENQ